MKNAVFLALTVFSLVSASFLLVIEPINAQTAVQTSVSIALKPNPVGVDQIMAFEFQVFPAPPNSSDRFVNLTATVTFPSGFKTWHWPVFTNATGGATLFYSFNQTGNYVFSVEFPGQSFENGQVYAPSKNESTLVVQAEPVETPIAYPTPNPAPTSSPAPTATVAPVATLPPAEQTSTPKPTPIPTPHRLDANTTSGVTVKLTLYGNVTASQFANVTLANESAHAAQLSFVLSGAAGNTGFGNVTIPKTMVPNAASIAILIDGQPAQNQGYSQNENYYYVWFTTHFSTHQVSIVFATNTPYTTASSPVFQNTALVDLVQLAILVLMGIIVAVVGVAAFLFLSKRRGTEQTETA